MIKLGLDLGYSAGKALYDNEFYKFPTSISFATDNLLDYGDDDSIIYNDKKYLVGNPNATTAFVTTDYSFKKKFDPLIIYYICKELDLLDEVRKGNVSLYLGLALTDWKYKDEYLELISSFEADGETWNFKIGALMPQGVGAVINWMNLNSEEHPKLLSCVDIGFNTINFIVFEKGNPVKDKSRSFPEYGVSSIIRPFKNFLESKYNMTFSEIEAINIFQENSFFYNGEEQEEVINMISNLQDQFVDKVFNSVLRSEKGILNRSNIVLISGGGVYFLDNIEFPQNVRFSGKPYEYANVGGYVDA